MSTISAVSSAGNAWTTLSAQRSQQQAKMFAKVDTDGSGSVDQSELSNMLGDISQKTGASFGDNKELFTKMDSNSDGKLSSEELGQGMKDLMPPPSTMDFAQMHSEGGHADGPPPPPQGAEGGPQGAAGAQPAASSSGTSGSSSSSSTTYDPLDINKDGTVSSMERLAGALKELVQESKKSDASGATDSSSQSELSKLAQKLYEQISASLQQTDSADSGSGSSLSAMA